MTGYPHEIVRSAYPERAVAAVETPPEGNRKRTRVVTLDDGRFVVVQRSDDPAALTAETRLAREIADRTAVPVPAVLEGGRDVVFSETEHSDVQNAYYSIRRGDWKYIRVVSPDAGVSSYVDQIFDPGFVRQFIDNPLYFLRRRFGGRSEHLYDLSVDPGETDNRIDEPGLADELRDELRTWREGLDSVASSGDEGGMNVDLSEDTRRQLREMGYL